MSQKTVVIVGAGFFGISTANRLANSTNHKIILVTISKHAYFLISSIRVPVQNKTEGTFVPIDGLVSPKVEVIQDEIVNFDECQVLFENHDDLKFDVLVIATGAKWPDPIGSNLKFKDDFEQYFEERHKEIENAKHIMPLREKVTSFVQGCQVDLRLSTRAKPLESDKNKLVLNGDPNDTIEGDLIVYGTGAVAAIPPNDISGFTDSKGFIAIDETFQVKAVEKGHIFSIGDVTDFEYRGLVLRRHWLNAIVKNIKLVLQNPSTATKEFYRVDRPSGNVTTFVSMGPEYGFGQLCFPWIGTMAAPNWFVVRYKSVNLCVSFAKILFNS
ncbi:unnamed protein product [Wickerhamomyces anomalus]